MSTQVFPSLPGLGWNVQRTEMWKTRAQEAISGAETRIADWSYPRHLWELTFEFLRQAGMNMQAATFAGTTYAEFSTLLGFFDLRSGAFDSFLYTDPDDNTVAGQPIQNTVTGATTGDGSTTTFQLLRVFGGYVEPMFAPHTVTAVYVDGVVIYPTGYTVSGWGTATPGIVTFVTAPTSGKVVSADFSYYFPVKFTDDTMNFEKFLAAFWMNKSVKIQSIKV